MQRLTIQRVLAVDWDRFRTIRLQALQSDPDAFGSTLVEELNQSPSFWKSRLQSDATTLIASFDQQDVGIVTLAPHWEDAESVGIFSVWVTPTARGQGVGDTMMEKCISIAKEQGFLRARLEVGDYNSAAISFYARWGFEPSGHTATLKAPRSHITEHERVLEFFA